MGICQSGHFPTTKRPLLVVGMVLAAICWQHVLCDDDDCDCHWLAVIPRIIIFAAVGPTRDIQNGGGIQGLSGIKISERMEDLSKAKRPGKRPSSPERWELAQLKHAGVLKVTDYPDFDAEGDVRPPATRRLLPPCVTPLPVAFIWCYQA
jgi:hypothetical protein